jgi:hypothetical protein
MHPERRPNPDRSAEALAARLRALPPPPVPAGLEARLLATIPAALPTPEPLPLSPPEGKGRGRWVVWVGVAGALAAACLLAILAWSGRDGNKPVPTSPTRESAHQPPPLPREDSASIRAWRESRRVLDGEEPPPFTWPLPETPPLRVLTSIPPDLLE